MFYRMSSNFNPHLTVNEEDLTASLEELKRVNPQSYFEVVVPAMQPTPQLDTLPGIITTRYMFVSKSYVIIRLYPDKALEQGKPQADLLTALVTLKRGGHIARFDRVHPPIPTPAPYGQYGEVSHD